MRRMQALYGRATGQLKNMGMMAFMMWMSGNQIQIFSIMMTANGIYQPILALSKAGEGAARLWLRSLPATAYSADMPLCCSLPCRAL